MAYVFEKDANGMLHQVDEASVDPSRSRNMLTIQGAVILFTDAEEAELAIEREKVRVKQEEEKAVAAAEVKARADAKAEEVRVAQQPLLDQITLLSNELAALKNKVNGVK